MDEMDRMDGPEAGAPMCGRSAYRCRRDAWAKLWGAGTVGQVARQRGLVARSTRNYADGSDASVRLRSPLLAYQKMFFVAGGNVECGIQD